MFLTDKVSIGQVRRTGDGYLVADAKVARTGIQQYTGAEVGKPEMPIVRVYRPPEQVFAVDAMRSYAYRPMTLEHPAKMVDADTWRAVAVGQTGGEVVRDGEFVRVPLVLMDGAAVKAWEAGTRELSMGYTSEIVFADGMTPEGEPYDAVQTDLRMNHLALVDRARGGKELRIGDGRSPAASETGAGTPTKEQAMSNPTTRTILVDGLSVETTDAGAQAITKLQGQINDAKTAAEKLVNDHATAMAAKDADLAKKDAEIDTLKGKVLTDAQLDQRVKERGDLIGMAKLIADADYSGKSADDIRRSAVVAKLGDAAVAGKSQAYVDARFDILAEDASKDPVRRVLTTGDARPASNDNGQTAYEQRLTNAWKGDANKGAQ